MFPMKIQPVDFSSPDEMALIEPVKPVVKSRFKRLFERPFGNVVRTSAVVVPEKVVADAGTDDKVRLSKDDEFEPSSVCLANMVRNFIEDSNEKQSSPLKCCQSRCYCFNGNGSDGSDDELESSHSYTCEILKNLVMCSSVLERNLLADTAKIVEKYKISNCKDEHSRKSVTDGLLDLGYDASICKSRWEKAPSYPAGEYDYVDVIIEDERLIVDIDFRSEFEIARSTKTYKAILQTLPQIFVGKADRLQKIIYLVSEAAEQSLKKKGMPLPPWRKPDYVKSKWLSSYIRTPPPYLAPSLTIIDSTDSQKPLTHSKKTTHSSILIADENSPASSDHSDIVFNMSVEDDA